MRNTVNTRPNIFLSNDLLKHIRDTQPTESELRQWLGVSEFGRYHVLRKAGLLQLREGRIVLSPEHRSADGEHFSYGNRRFNLDDDSVDVFCRLTNGLEEE